MLWKHFFQMHLVLKVGLWTLPGSKRPKSYCKSICFPFHVGNNVKRAMQPGNILDKLDWLLIKTVKKCTLIVYKNLIYDKLNLRKKGYVGSCNFLLYSYSPQAPNFFFLIVTFSFRKVFVKQLDIVNLWHYN